MSDKLDGAFDFYFAKPTNTLMPEQANFGLEKGLNRTCKVGTYESNRLGLFDMHGNVWEWCDDTVKDDDGATARVPRGGSWYSDSTEQCRAVNRHVYPPSNRYADRGLRLARVPSGAPAPDMKTPGAVAPFTDADVKSITALPAEQQVEEVRKELMRRNPGFEGKLETKIEGGIVTEFKIVTDHVTDIAPIRVFNALRVLELGGAFHQSEQAKGRLADLSPLTGMDLSNLTYLSVANNARIDDADLVHFKNCKNLRGLWLNQTQVTNAGMANFEGCKKLQRLNLKLTKVDDAGLAHFKDCKDLNDLDLGGLNVTDDGLANFKDCKGLNYLWLNGTRVTDAGLAQFKGCTTVTHLHLARTQATDAGLANLKDCKDLSFVVLENTKVTDAGLVHFKNCQKLSVINLVKTSVTAGAVDEFKKTHPKCRIEWEGGVIEPKATAAPLTDADVKRIAALPAAEQVEEVRKELLRRNPGFDGKVGHKIEEGVVTELRINTDKVTDISPIRVFNALRVLNLGGTATEGQPNGRLADLTPLRGMKLSGLTMLSLANTPIDDAGLAHFKDCKSLEILWLNCTPVTNAGVGLFKSCTALKSLTLNNTRVDDAGLVHFKDCKGLTGIDLGGLAITDTGLAHFKDCKDLTHLVLYETRVTNAGLAHFKDCKDLTFLHLKQTSIGDAGLAHFKDCKKLTWVDLAETEITDAGLAHLKGMPLKWLWIHNTAFTNLTPLQGMQLEGIILTPKNITKGMDILRDMKSLKTIGIEWQRSWPAAEFWERYDKGEFKE